MTDHEEIEVLEARITKLENQLLRYRGFIGGVVFVFSSLIAIFELFGVKLGIR